MSKERPVNEKIDKAYQEYAKQHFNTGIKQDFATMLGVIAGSALMAFNIAVMLKNGDMISAGFTGIIMIIQRIVLNSFNISIPFTPLTILFNLFPAILCFRFVGKKFTLFSCISLVLVSLMADFCPEIFFTDDRLLIAVFGGILNGVGGALILRSGASAGGTDFVAMYYSVRKGINTFNYVLAFNTVLILSAGVLYGMESSLYTIIYQFVTTQVINFLYRRFVKKTLFIVTKHPHEVADAIMSSTHHACTIFNSVEGSYSGEQKHVVYTIIGANETSVTRKIIKGTDPNAFINTLNSDEVSGPFFSRPIN